MRNTSISILAAVLALAVSATANAQPTIAVVDLEKLIRLHPNTADDKKLLEATLELFVPMIVAAVPVSTLSRSLERSLTASVVPLSSASSSLPVNLLDTPAVHVSTESSKAHSTLFQ